MVEQIFKNLGRTASLKVVNPNLFGLKQFNMGLPKFKQDENARPLYWKMYHKYFYQHHMQ